MHTKMYKPKNNFEVKTYLKWIGKITHVWKCFVEWVMSIDIGKIGELISGVNYVIDFFQITINKNILAIKNVLHSDLSQLRTNCKVRQQL